MPFTKTHGMSRTRLYKIWADMKARCIIKSCKSYLRYGGRGIKVCNQWGTFENFRDWALSHGYTNELTIERINVNGNYEPNNCKFIPWVEQYDNRRNTIKFKAISPLGEIFESQNASKFSREHGLNRKMVNRVIREERNHHRGWTFIIVEGND